MTGLDLRSAFGFVTRTSRGLPPPCRTSQLLGLRVGGKSMCVNGVSKELAEWSKTWGRMPAFWREF